MDVLRYRGIENFKDYLEWLRKYDTQIALRDGIYNESYTFRQLTDQVFSLSSCFDIQTGERVILFDTKPLDWVVLFFAVIVRGGIVVPVDTRASEDFFHDIIKLVKPVLIVHGGVLKYASMGIRDISVDILRKSVQKPFLPPMSATAPCEIIFTSGTWSKPKGVTLSQENILNNVWQLLGAYPERSARVFLGILPLSHAYQQVFGLLAPLARGSQVVFLSELSSLTLSRVVRRYAVDTLPLIPRVLSLLQNSILRSIKGAQIRKLLIFFISYCRHLPLAWRRILFFRVHRAIGPSLRLLISGGAPLDKDLDDFFQGIGYELYVGYGLSECAPIVSASLNQKRRPGEVGRPLPGVRVTITSNSEILVSGKNVFLGYWPNISGNQEFNTGDVGYLTAEGSIVLRGRNKNLHTAENGEKIFFEDIESLVGKVSGVEDCCVLEAMSEGEMILSCIVCMKKNTALDTGNLLKVINKKLPWGIRIKNVYYVQWEEFYYTHTLKIDRKRMQKVLDAHQHSSYTHSTSEAYD